ncbi:hypothetical protein, partial [Staphylococcus saprophyticus]|uniref:hypothetical protein n=1 Tax=Staphylococcus saprophyticus TaxID=29385 RepID=UPI0011AA0A1C
MYGGGMSILEGNEKGEIDDGYVEEFFEEWLNDRGLKIGRENGGEYGGKGLKLERLETPRDIKWR